MAALPLSVQRRNPQLPATTAPARRAPRAAVLRAADAAGLLGEVAGVEKGKGDER